MSILFIRSSMYVYVSMKVECAPFTVCSATYIDLLECGRCRMNHVGTTDMSKPTQDQFIF
jgi:hypothetical protein